MNPDAVEWLESQDLVHPVIRAVTTGQRSDGPTAIRQMVEVIDDHPLPACAMCGVDALVL